MPIQFACSQCAKMVQVPDGTEGKKCICPQCQSTLTIPRRESTNDIVTDIQLEVACPRCEHVLVCDPSLEGTRGLCPKCKFIFTIDPTVTASIALTTDQEQTFPFQCPHCQQLFEGRLGMEGRKGTCINCHKVFDIVKHVEPPKPAEPSGPVKVSVPISQRPKQHRARPKQTGNSIDQRDSSAPPKAKPVPATPRPAAPRYVSPKIQPSLPASPLPAYAPPSSSSTEWYANLSSIQQPTTASDYPYSNYYQTVAPAAASRPARRALSGSPSMLRSEYLWVESAAKGMAILVGILAVLWVVMGFLMIAAAILAVSIAPQTPEYFLPIMMVGTTIVFCLAAGMSFLSRGLAKLNPVARVIMIILTIIQICAILVRMVLIVIGFVVVMANQIAQIPLAVAMTLMVGFAGQLFYGGMLCYFVYVLLCPASHVVFSDEYRAIKKQTSHIDVPVPAFVPLFICAVLIQIMVNVIGVMIQRGIIDFS